MQRGSVEYGHAFEHLIMQELIAYLGYTHDRRRLSYWRTYTGIEVDAIIGDAELAIEIKSVEVVQSKHLKGLHAFHEEHPDCRMMIVSFDPITRTQEGVEVTNVREFLSKLWNGELLSS